MIKDFTRLFFNLFYTNGSYEIISIKEKKIVKIYKMVNNLEKKKYFVRTRRCQKQDALIGFTSVGSKPLPELGNYVS